MTYPVSACSFIRSTFEGAFCIFESMASLLPFVDEYIVLDLGSTDGTLHYLRQIADANPKVKLLQGTFPTVDAGVFATLANDLIALCKNEHVWYHQSDEIPHQHLLGMVEEKFKQGQFDWAFWRIQLGYNWQEPRWLPHLIHRLGPKSNFVFVGDGMNTDRTFGTPVCSTRDAGWFSKWGELYEQEGPSALQPWIREMVLDVSLLGGFRDNVPTRRALHSPFWREQPTIEYRPSEKEQNVHLPADEWMRIAKTDDRWIRTESPYDIPHIMQYHLGRTRYELRRSLFDALCQDDTRKLLGV